MAIEIRELVVKAVVVKPIQREGEEMITKREFQRMRQDLIYDIMERVETLLEESRDRR